MLLRCARVLGSLAAGLLLTAAGAMAAEAPKEMKLYVFSSGALNLDKSIIQNGASGKVQIPVGFFLIRHPKGRRAVRLRQQRQDHHQPRLLGTVREGARSGPLARHRHRHPAQQDQRQAVRHQVCRARAFPRRPCRQYRQVPRLDLRVSARRDQERVLAGTGLRHFLHHRRFCHAAQRRRWHRCRASTRPSSSTATSICSATTASTSIAPCRTPREARSWSCVCRRPARSCSPATPSICRRISTRTSCRASAAFMIRSACSTPMPGSSGCTTPRAATSSTRTIRTSYKAHKHSPEYYE